MQREPCESLLSFVSGASIVCSSTIWVSSSAGFNTLGERHKTTKPVSSKQHRRHYRNKTTTTLHIHTRNTAPKQQAVHVDES